MNKPMGVSECTLVEALPDNLKGALPTVEEIENNLQQLQHMEGNCGWLLSTIWALLAAKGCICDWCEFKFLSFQGAFKWDG